MWLQNFVLEFVSSFLMPFVVSCSIKEYMNQNPRIKANHYQKHSCSMLTAMLLSYDCIIYSLIKPFSIKISAHAVALLYSVKTLFIIILFKNFNKFFIYRQMISRRLIIKWWQFIACPTPTKDRNSKRFFFIFNT